MAIRNHLTRRRLQKFLRANAYVDREWYLARYPDVANIGMDAQDHYVNYGLHEGRQPNLFFHPEFYLSQVERADQIALTPLEDYATRGWKIGLNPSGEFHALEYLKRNPDVAANGEEPLLHFIRTGRSEGRSSYRVPVEDLLESNVAGALPSFLTEKFLKLLPMPTRAASRIETFDGRSLEVHWIIPDFNPGAGGHMAIFKAIYWLEYLGHSVTIWIDYPNQRKETVAVYEEIIRHFRPIKSRIRLLHGLETIQCDVLFATDHGTVWSAIKHGKIGAKRLFYFVQDYEPYFFSMGSEFLYADMTYDQELFCVWRRKFGPAVERRLNSPIQPINNITIPRKVRSLAIEGPSSHSTRDPLRPAVPSNLARLASSSCPDAASISKSHYSGWTLESSSTGHSP
jgi:hypothetical protein